MLFPPRHDDVIIDPALPLDFFGLGLVLAKTLSRTPTTNPTTPTCVTQSLSLWVIDKHSW